MSSFNVSSYGNYSNAYQPKSSPFKTGNIFDSGNEKANVDQPWYSQTNQVKNQTPKKNYTGVMSFNLPKVIGDLNKNSVESASLKAHSGNAGPTNNFNLFRGMLA
jgi:hypothetical protein